ncbi:MAG: terpene cyclase/mutase family protein [Candidatus Brocadiae bacterium]|nr:terpene cyclase/mutase family protein [Candidatus Brocadiia bacterium]
MTDETRVGQEDVAGGVTVWVEQQVRNTPWWLISIAFHLIVLAGMTVITFQDDVKKLDPPQITVLPPRAKPDLLPPLRDTVDTAPGWSPKDVPVATEKNDEPILPNYEDAIDGHKNTSDVDPLVDNDGMRGESRDLVGAELGGETGFGRGQGGPGVHRELGVGGGAGTGGRWGDPFSDGSRNMRKVGLAGLPKGTTAATENAVTYGLRWLARHQGTDGAWSADGFHHQCKGTTCTHSGYKEYDAGVTGLSLLAFLGAGYTHLSKESYTDEVTGKKIRYGDVVKSACKWLIEHQDAEGCFGGRSGHKYMYNHSIAALAMTEAFGLTNASLFREPAQRGIDFLAAAQMPYKAWRYSKNAPDNDTSVTGWCVMAMKSAEMAGLQVSRSSYDGAKNWVSEVTDEQYYRTGYTAKNTGKVVVPGKNDDWDNHDAMTAVGMLCRIFIEKNEKDPALVGGARLLVADLPQYSGKKVDYYYWYYGSLALFQLDGPKGQFWNGWNTAMVNALVPNQKAKAGGCQYGSWDADVDRWGFEGGRVYSTALNVLTLEVYYRYASAFGGKR